jgi:dTDP-4-amino-4,6-dideoxygalactose transaminase
MEALMAIAERHGLRVISDAAQAPGARYKGKFAGTLADVGGFSLNYHKHIHTGEGGILVTNDDEIADRARLIRNHAEAVAGGRGLTDLRNMIGFNFRLGEIECAMGIEQLKKLNAAIGSRRRAAERLTQGLGALPGLRTPVVRSECTHVYYYYPMVLDVDLLGVSKARIADALKAEGVTGLSSSYQNLHLFPMYQQKIAYGSGGFPWTSDICHREVNYAKGICPVAERLEDESFLGLFMCLNDLPDSDVDLIVNAFQKVWDQLDQLK